MSSDSEFEPPQFTSTQASPKRVDTKQKLAFMNQMKGMNINNLLKSKAMTLSKSNCLAKPASRLQLLPSIKHKPMDDERDSSYYSSNEAKKINDNDDSSSSDESSNSSSGSESDAKTNEKVTVKTEKLSPQTMSLNVKKEVVSGTESENESSDSEESSSSDTDQEETDGRLETPSAQNKEKQDSSSEDSESSSQSDSDGSSSSDEEEHKESKPPVTTKQAQTDTLSETVESSSGSDSESSSASSSDENGSESDEETTQKPSKPKSTDSDESSDSEEELNTSLNKTKYIATQRSEKIQADYVDMYHLEAAQLTDAFNVGDITADDEVFLCRIENNIDPMTLTKSKLTFEKRQALTVSDTNGSSKNKILVDFDKEDKDKLCVLANMFGEFGITHLQTQGVLTISENRSINIGKPANIEFKKKEKIPFPTDKLRTRHPIFGRSFEKKIVLDEDVVKKLVETKTNAKKEMSPAKKSKKDKRKSKTDEDVTDGVKKSKKKKKKHDDVVEDIEMPRSIKKEIDTLFSSTVNDDDIHRAIFEPDESGISTHKKKKKKDKSKGKDVLSDIIQATLADLGNTSPKTKSKEKKRKRKHSEALPENPKEEVKEKKSKKKKSPTVD